MANKKKRTMVMVIALTVVFGGIWGFNVFKGIMIKKYFANFEPPAVSVSSTKAKKMDWKPTIPAVGNFVAINGVDVSSEAAGIVVGLHFKPGQYVEKNTLLIDLGDNTEKANLKFNQSDLTLQKINFERQNNLYKKGATSSSNVDAARAKLLQAEANVEKTEELIRQKHITSPFAGLLGIRQVNLGEYVSPGQTTIVSLQSMDPLFLEFYLPEQDRQKIYVGQKITFSVEQYPGLMFTGTINALNSKIDTNTHNLKVQAIVPNCPLKALKAPQKSDLIQIKPLPYADKKLVICQTKTNEEKKVKNFSFMPGMFAKIEVDQPLLKDVIIVPNTAISYSLYGDSVYVIEHGKKDKNGKEKLTVKRTFVRTGAEHGNFVRIISGIKEGDEVVSSGELKLQTGATVTINNSVKLNKDLRINNLKE